MKLVGAGLGDDVDDSARKPPVLCTGDAAHHREFARGIDSQQDSRLTGGGTLPVATNVHTVQKKGGLGKAGPGNGYFFSGVAGLALGPGLEIADTGLNKSQLGETSPVQGQIYNLPLIHQASQDRRGSFHQSSLPFHNHTFGNLTDAQSEIDNGLSPHRELDSAAHAGLEAGQSGLYFIVAQAQIGSPIGSLVTGNNGSVDSRVGVGESDLNPGQHAAGFIGDGP